ncbi:MAG: lysophospholipid acyltransferase family protein [Thermoanaerobaculia bacterium]
MIESSFERLVRRAMILGIGNLATPVYFRWLNDVKAEGAELLKALPRKNVVFLSNHQTYFTEAIALYDLLYIVHGFPYQDPHLRFSAATETMKKNILTKVLTYAGGVTFRRSFREAGREVNRPVDLEGISKVEEAIATGWLLHFPTGTTQKHAPIRPGMAQLLHRTKPIAVPMRVDGFREMLLHKQFPGRTGKKATIRFFPPMDLADFYAQPFDKERGRNVIEELGKLILDPA